MGSDCSEYELELESEPKVLENCNETMCYCTFTSKHAEKALENIVFWVPRQQTNTKPLRSKKPQEQPSQFGAVKQLQFLEFKQHPFKYEDGNEKTEADYTTAPQQIEIETVDVAYERDRQKHWIFTIGYASPLDYQFNSIDSAASNSSGISLGNFFKERYKHLQSKYLSLGITFLNEVNDDKSKTTNNRNESEEESKIQQYFSIDCFVQSCGSPVFNDHFRMIGIAMGGGSNNNNYKCLAMTTNIISALNNLINSPKSLFPTFTSAITSVFPSSTCSIITEMK